MCNITIIPFLDLALTLHFRLLANQLHDLQLNLMSPGFQSRLVGQLFLLPRFLDTVRVEHQYNEREGKRAEEYKDDEPGEGDTPDFEAGVGLEDDGFGAGCEGERACGNG